MTKVCTKCGQEKLLGEFSLSGLGAHRKAASCKSCVSAYFKGYYLKNKKKLNSKNLKQQFCSKYGPLGDVFIEINAALKKEKIILEPQVKILREIGKSYEEIGDQLGISSPLARKLVARVGAKKPHIKDLDQAISELRKQRTSVVEISNRFNISVGSVNRSLTRTGTKKTRYRRVRPTY